MKAMKAMKARNSGSILIGVMWVILALSMLSFSLAASVRLQARANQYAFDSERALLMAKGAADTVYSSVSKGQTLPVDSPIRQGNDEFLFPFESGQAVVRFESAAGWIDVNAASRSLLAAMLDSLDIGQEARLRLLASILERRQRGAFETVDELLSLEGMTPALFYGSVAWNKGADKYQRTSGIRDLVTVRSGSGKVNPNIAPPDVLAALPGMTPQLAAHVVSERVRKAFANVDDLASRIPAIPFPGAGDYLNFDPPRPSTIVSQATIAASGVSRTVRLFLKRGSGAPGMLERDYWRFE
jgi:general secretion pathway protein K